MKVSRSDPPGNVDDLTTPALKVPFNVALRVRSTPIADASLQTLQLIDGVTQPKWRHQVKRRMSSDPTSPSL